MINPRSLLPIGIAVLGLVVPAAAADREPGSKHSPKIDKALSAALNEGGATQHVIITLKPGHRAAMRQRLHDHGDLVLSEYASIDALAVDIHSADVNELAGRDEVAALSLDADIYADGSRKDDNGRRDKKDGTADPAPLTRTLRETLGLPRVATSSTLTGSTGIGVIIIDSGITPSLDFSGRITGFYDLVRGNGKSSLPYD